MIAGTGVGLGLGLMSWARRRARALRPLPEAVPHRPIGELEQGRFRIEGRIDAIETVDSPSDGAACVFVESAEYRTLGSELVPLLKQVGHTMQSHPFYLDDGTGRLWVDPATLDIEAVTLTEDSGLYAERRLRAGEEVELVATFRPRSVEAAGGPYRSQALAWEPVDDALGRPRLTYRTEPGMIRPRDEGSAFRGGAGALLVAAGTAFGALALWF